MLYPSELPGHVIGGAEEDRTPDLVIANDALSQLSYGPDHDSGSHYGCVLNPGYSSTTHRTDTNGGGEVAGEDGS